MKPIQLTKEAIKKLYFILNTLFPEFQSIEIFDKDLPHVLFSTVPKNNLLRIFASKYVIQKLPIAELFLKEIPKRFSIYQFRNDSMMPVYFITSSILIADNPQHLINYFYDKLKDMPPAREQKYSNLIKKLNNLETTMNEENYNPIKGLLKSLSPDVIGSSKMFKAFIIHED